MFIKVDKKDRTITFRFKLTKELSFIIIVVGAILTYTITSVLINL